MAPSDGDEIRIQLDRMEPLLGAGSGSPFREGSIAPEADRFLLAQLAASPRDSSPRLVITVPLHGAREASGAIDALRRHAVGRRAVALDRMHANLREGRWNLLIAGVFLVAMVVVGQGLRWILPEGTVASTIEQGVTILGWVALWRPLEQLLYDWRPYRREARLYARLAAIEVEMRETPPTE